MPESEDTDARLRQLSLLDWLQRGVIELEAKSKADNDALRARIVELEAEVALLRGTLAQPTSETLTEYTHNLPPDAPR